MGRDPFFPYTNLILVRIRLPDTCERAWGESTLATVLEARMMRVVILLCGELDI